MKGITQFCIIIYIFNIDDYNTYSIYKQYVHVIYIKLWHLTSSYSSNI